MMKRILFFLLTAFPAAAQQPCEYAMQVNDSLGVYKSTKDYLMHEKVFGNSRTLLYFSLVQSDGMPMLNLQLVQKSTDFIPANCLDKNSRIFLQLDNGKIVPLIHLDQDNCGTTVRIDDVNNRIISSYFMFVKDSYDELKKSNVSLLRIKYATGKSDFVIRPSFTSETDGITYTPERYFIDHLRCVEN